MTSVSILPSSSFVRFTARQLASPKIIWKNTKAGIDLNWNKFAYCIPDSRQDVSTYTDQERIMYGERYGGRGVGTHGGGVRCGLDDNFQIKGIGRNPLASRKVSETDANGAATISEAAREAIWAGISGNVLPYGAAKTLAIITSCGVYPEAETKLSNLRTLIVRQSELRPAHFMRAVNFLPTATFQNINVSDTTRTRRAIEFLEHALRYSFQKDVAQDCGPNFISTCLVQMVHRFAAQVAAARVKRIPHGALTCSNICLDGRYIDFGTQSAVPDYDRAVLARGNPDLWNDHKPFLHTINDLLFYVHSYSNEKIKTRIIGAQELTSFYLKHFKTRLMLEYMKLSGIPEFDIAKIPQSTREKMSSSILEILEAGSAEPYRFWDGAEKHVVSPNLNAVFEATAWCNSRADAEEAVTQLIPNSCIRQRFSDSLFELKSSALACQKDGPKKFYRTFVSLNCLRQNKTTPSLYRYNIDKSISGLNKTAFNHDDLSIYIDEQIALGTGLRSEPRNDSISLNALLKQPFSYSSVFGLVADGDMGSRSELDMFLRSDRSSYVGTVSKCG